MGFETLEKLDEAGRRYEKYVLRDGLLAGCILLGSRENYSFAAQKVGKPTTSEEIRPRLAWSKA